MPLSREQFAALPSDMQGKLASGSPLGKEDFSSLPEDHQKALAEPVSGATKDKPNPWGKYDPDSTSAHIVDAAATAGSYLAKKASDVSDALESYTRAPTRAAMDAIQNGKNPISAAYNQMGDNKTAPSGQKIVEKAGVSTSKSPFLNHILNLGAEAVAGLGTDDQSYGDTSPELKNNIANLSKSQIAGSILEQVADPLNLLLIPGATKTVGKGVSALADMAKSIPGVEEAAGVAGKVVKGARNAGMNVAFDLPAGTVEDYLNGNKAAINAAAPKPQIAQKIADTFGAIKNETPELSETATKALSKDRVPNKGMDLNDVFDLLDKVDSPETKSLKARLLDSYIDRKSGISSMAPEVNADFLNQQEMHEVKKTLQGLGKWGSAVTDEGRAAANSGAGIANEALRSANPEYASAMDSLSENIRTRNDLAKKFGIKPEYHPGGATTYSPTDQTLTAIDQVARGNKIDRAKILSDLAEQGFGDLGEEIKRSAQKAQLSGGHANGARRAVMFGAAGAAGGGAIAGAPGAWLGGALGSSIGGAADKFAGPMGKALMDASMAGSDAAKKLATPINSLFGTKSIQAVDDMAAVNRRLKK